MGMARSPTSPFSELIVWPRGLSDEEMTKASNYLLRTLDTTCSDDQYLGPDGCSCTAINQTLNSTTGICMCTDVKNNYLVDRVCKDCPSGAVAYCSALILSESDAPIR